MPSDNSYKYSVGTYRANNAWNTFEEEMFPYVAGAATVLCVSRLFPNAAGRAEQYGQYVSAGLAAVGLNTVWGKMPEVVRNNGVALLKGVGKLARAFMTPFYDMPVGLFNTTKGFAESYNGTELFDVRQNCTLEKCTKVESLAAGAVTRFGAAAAGKLQQVIEEHGQVAGIAATVGTAVLAAGACYGVYYAASSMYNYMTTPAPANPAMMPCVPMSPVPCRP